MPQRINTSTLPVELEHTALTELAKVFCAKLGKPKANELELAGFHDLADLLLRGWILREPGRYSIGYLPGPAVIEQMWAQNDTLCLMLRLKRPEARRAA